MKQDYRVCSNAATSAMIRAILVLNSRMKTRIPKFISWLILLKGIISLTLGILSFFGAIQASLIHYLNVTILFWDVSPTKSITAILIGLGYITVGRGLYQGKHLAWQVALFWLSLNILDSLLPRVIPFQLLYAIIMLLLLWLNRAYFNKPTKNPMRPQQVIAFLSIVSALAYGVIGCYLLRAQYQGINNWVDAIYYSLETYSTIGYGDIVPITNNAKIFTCSMIVIGVGSFIAAVSILLGPMLEQRMKKVVYMVNKLSIPKNHVIVVGATTLGLHIAKVLQNKGKSVIVIDQEVDALKPAENPLFKVIAGDPSQENTLEAVHLKTASAIVCAFNSDANNLLITMVAHAFRQRFRLKFKIIVRIDEPQNIVYATQNGADEVISPAVIVGEMIANELSTPAKNME